MIQIYRVCLQEEEVNEVWLTLPLALKEVPNAPILYREGPSEGHKKDLENVTNSSGNVTNSSGNVTNSSGNVTNNSENVTDSSENVTKIKIRRKAILDIIKSDCNATTEEIAEQLHVSKRTILRDLEALTNSKIIKRESGTFGGKWVFNVE